MRPGPTARAAAVLVVFLGLFWGVDRFLGHDGGRQAAGTSRRTAAVAPASTSAPTTTAKPAATHRPATTATTATTAPPASATTLRPAAGVTVQVLDGAFRNGQGRKVAAMLRAAGYDVLATQSAFGDYPVSRVYYGQGHLDDALALQRRFPAFQVVLPATESGTGLSTKVDLSAVVGKNFP